MDNPSQNEDEGNGVPEVEETPGDAEGEQLSAHDLAVQRGLLQIEMLTESAMATNAIEGIILDRDAVRRAVFRRLYG